MRARTFSPWLYSILISVSLLMLAGCWVTGGQTPGNSASDPTGNSGVDTTSFFPKFKEK